MAHQAAGRSVDAEDLAQPFESRLVTSDGIAAQEAFQDAFALKLSKTFPPGEVLRIQNPEEQEELGA